MAPFCLGCRHFYESAQVQDRQVDVSTGTDLVIKLVFTASAIKASVERFSGRLRESIVVSIGSEIKLHGRAERQDDRGSSLE